MLIQRRYLGTHRDGRTVMGESRVFVTDRGFLDDGRPYLFRTRSNRVWMAGGPGGEAMLRGLHLILAYTVATQARVTPIVDGRVVTDAIDILDLTPDPTLDRSVTTHWVDVKEAIGTDRPNKIGVRGAAAQVMVEFFGVVPTGTADYILAVDECHLEVEVVRSSVPMSEGVAR